MILWAKHIIYFLISTISVVHTMPEPIQYARTPRQVVQPKWLSLKENLPLTDGKVHVTKERLDEVEALRQSIQKAVDNGDYAIESPTQSPSGLSDPKPTSTTAVPKIKTFKIFGSDFSQHAASAPWTDFLSGMQRQFFLIFGTPSPLSLNITKN